MRTVQGLMSELGAALQFFDGFGENWYALEECLEYLDEWLPADAYILVIENAEEVLQEEDSSQMEALLSTLHEVGESWARPVTQSDRFNRREKPFHVLFNVSSGDTCGVERIVSIAHGAGIPIRV